MRELEDLEQDIDALEKEIESLKKRTADVKGEIRDKRLGGSRTKDTTNVVIQEFESVFEKFPQLYDILYNDYRPDASDNDDNDTNSVDSAGSNRANQTNNRSVSATATPVKTGKDKAHQQGNRSDEDLPEDEWVLKNQVPIEHQMFDQSVGDLLDTDILSSPSKRKRNPAQHGADTSRLHEKILLENAYRLFGITYFPVVDPADLQLNAETQKMVITREMLGVRFDVFNDQDSKFEKPFYVLLKKNLKAKVWEIFKHTIPGNIDVHSLFHTITGGLATSNNDIYLFSKEVYVRLVQSSLRLKHFNSLQERGLIEDLRGDLRSTNVSFMTGPRFMIDVKLTIQNNEVVSVYVKKGKEEVKSKLAMFLTGPIDDLEGKLKQLTVEKFV
ncbi:Mcm21p KNAG_0C05520 [Huiozyma naganishii CBS 8797]|uniref:Central kinetochore subunit MCM21 n=1 Tax=Huiozyma naganishii (strain ATCC MYA-139 / BCRC 22969 / CBS 8797 / KCTC 17520 / NBRC 10181 / NCYC 3082 / Yp74L-3) TaxID=1071383 RepID=J7R478_HUIN7|nr:hypothetical protein KNAG_0C05520 [Kazachstania naganishii CBS 8797]CCK69650.1 hypothetical protein KNAG_0C05520 [Kazachstania naganishii CBS 8797]